MVDTKDTPATFETLLVGKEDGAHLSLSSHGLKMYDDTGAIRTEVWMEDGPAVLLYDRNGQERLALFVEDDGTPHIRMHDANGKPRIRLSVDMGGSPCVQLLDATGDQDWSALGKQGGATT